MVQLDWNRGMRVAGAGDPFLRGVSDLELATAAGQVVIYTATRGGGAGLAGWRLDGAGSPQRFDAAGFPGGVAVGQDTRLLLLDMGGAAPHLAATGVNRAGLWSFAMGEGGAFSGSGASPGTRALPADLAQVLQLDQGTRSLVFGTPQGQDRILTWQLSQTGALVQMASTPADLAEPGARITGLASYRHGSTDYLVASADGATGLGVYRLDEAGRPALLQRFDMDSGPGIAGAAAVVSTLSGGVAHVVVAGQGSGTLSVFRAGAGGRLTATDHVMDAPDMRLGGVRLLEVAEHHGRVWLAAAGSEHGLSLFELLPDGRLLHMGTLEDGEGSTLASISAMDLAVGPDGVLRLAVTSGSEPGLTVFAADLPAGLLRQGTGSDAPLAGSSGDDLLAGGAGAERILGGAGNDIVMDGAGSDTLTGGTGADIFVLTADGAPDVITDFQPGIDRIDLSGWAFLRNPDQLTLRETEDGAEIAFGREVLRLTTATGTGLPVARIRAMDLLEADRLMPGWFAQVLAEAAETTGTDRADRLTGGMARDILSGGGGSDTLTGLAGDDRLDGGPGADLLMGGPGSDVYVVDNLGDRVLESPRWQGQDHVLASVDFWMGGAHLEDLTLTGTAPLRGIGNGLANRITGNAGANLLDGGKNSDTLVGGAGHDTYLVRSPGDTVIEAPGEGLDIIKAFRSYALPAHVEHLYLQTVRTTAGTPVSINGIGNDLANTIVGTPYDNVIAGRGGRDILRGQGGADTFIFDRAPGPDNVDRVLDFTPGEDVLWIKAQLFGLAPGGVSRAMFHEGRSAADAGDRLLYDAATGGVWVDPDGTGPKPAQLTFVLNAGVDLGPGDVLFF